MHLWKDGGHHSLWLHRQFVFVARLPLSVMVIMNSRCSGSLARDLTLRLQRASTRFTLSSPRLTNVQMVDPIRICTSLVDRSRPERRGRTHDGSEQFRSSSIRKRARLETGSHSPTLESSPKFTRKRTEPRLLALLGSTQSPRPVPRRPLVGM